MRIFYILLLMLIQIQSFSQDPNFSQFFASPLTINPANTGNFEGILRASANMRTQLPEFGNAYSTKTMSLESQVLKKYIKQNDKLSMGVLILSDQTGNKLFNDNNISLSISYKKSLDKNARHSIAAGFQANYRMYRFDPSKAMFEDQLSGNGFSLPSSEIILRNNFIAKTIDFNTGLLYTGSITNNDLFYLGVSYYHLSKPEIGFISPSYFTASRFNVHGGSYLLLTNRTSFHTSFQYQRQGTNNELIFGGALSYYIGNENGYELFAGLWNRAKANLIPYLGLEWNHFRAGFTYDVAANNKLTSSRFYQSSELSLIYILQKKDNTPGISCPKF